MKSIFSVLILIVLLFCSCRSTKSVPETKTVAAQPREQAVPYEKYSDASTWIIGYFELSRLSLEPHAEWFIKGMDNYSGNQQVLDTLKGISTDGVSIKIVLGTWCPDSRREVPRFVKILKEINFPAAGVKFIGVDNMKFSPVDNYNALGIERVPTFIFYKNNIETGRIIENPTTSLEQDMVNILARNEKH
jgi:thiol-disulfide isomerase/thioredoxin